MKKFLGPFISKKAFKRRAGKCQICGEERYELLDVHRWRIPGKDKGKYTNEKSYSIQVRSLKTQSVHLGPLDLIFV